MDALNATDILAALSLSPKMGVEEIRQMDAMPFILAYKAFKTLIDELKGFSLEKPTGGKIQ